MRQSFSHAVERRIEQIMDAVPHVSASANWAKWQNKPDYDVTIRINGWGPSLHEAAFNNVRKYATEKDMLASIEGFAQRLADEQSTIVAAAKRFGLEQPLILPYLDNYNKPLNAKDVETVSRLSMERAFIDVMIQKQGANGAADDIIREFYRLMRHTQSESFVIHGGGSWLELLDGHSMFGMKYSIGGPADAILVGSALSLVAQLPETVLNAAIGKPLGQLVETRLAPLDNANIVSTATHAHTLTLTTESDPVILSEHPGLAEGFAKLIEMEALKYD